LWLWASLMVLYYFLSFCIFWFWRFLGFQ
jgi:hypothetical protein